MTRDPVVVRRVALVRPDDPAYLEEMSRQATAHRRLGARQDPGDLYRASGHVEAAVRAWLERRVPLLDERVVDAELRPADERGYVRRFLELDAVVGRDGVPVAIVEMKFSIRPGAVRRGLAQLGRARDLLRHRWPDLGRLLILVEGNRSGVALDLERLRGVELIGAEMVGPALRQAQTSLLVLTAADLAGHLDATALALVERGHDEGDALTAARLARAVREADAEPASSSAAGTTGPAVRGHDDEPAPSIVFGDDPSSAEASPFAALAGLRLPDEAPGED